MALFNAAKNSLREGKLKAVVYIDFDGLKAVNDSHGHAFGDQLLVAAVRRISECCDGRAELGRVGGDEFLVLAYLDAPELAEEIRLSVGLPYFIEDVHVSLSASCGVSQVDEMSQIDDLMNTADLAMMSAKRSGKNRVVEYQVGLSTRLMRLRHLNSGIQLSRAASFDSSHSPLSTCRLA